MKITTNHGVRANQRSPLDAAMGSSLDSGAQWRGVSEAER